MLYIKSELGKFENESLKEQNDQLFQQYEREKSFHKEYQQVISFIIKIH